MGKAIKRFIGIFLLAFTVGFSAFAGARLVALKEKAADTENREELKRNAALAASFIDPSLASMLTFTAGDEGTLPYDKIRRQLTSFSSGLGVRGIYTMALREGDIVFGPETYDRDDPMSSLPGTVYQKPSRENLEIFVTGKEYVYGPVTDEFGTFITAIAPVKDPVTGRVIIAVGIDMLAETWDQKIFHLAKDPITSFLTLFTVIIFGAVAARYYTRIMTPGYKTFASWIIIPVAAVLFLITTFFAVHEYEGGVASLSSEIQEVKALSENKWERIVKGQADNLRLNINAVVNDSAVAEAWDARDIEVLYEKSEPLFKEFSASSKITHFYFVDKDQTCSLRVHAPSRKGDRIDRSTMKIAVYTGCDSWGLEMGPLGTFTLRYVRPWQRGGQITGYVELGMEIEHLKKELTGFSGIDMMTILSKKNTTKENFLEGKKAFGYPGEWDDFDDHVVISNTLGEMSLELQEKIIQKDLFSRGDIFKVEHDGKIFFSGVIPVYSIMGEKAAVMVITQDMTERMAEIKSEMIFNVSVAFTVLFGVVVLLWYITGKVEEDLRTAFDSVKESEEKIAVTLTSMGDAVIVTDTSGCVTRMNPVAEKLTGWSFKDALARPLTEVFSIINTRSREVLPDLAKQVLSSGETISLANHTSLISRGGKEYHIADSAAPIKGIDGKIKGIVIVFHDVTEQYVGREELVKIQERLSIATRGTGMGIWDYSVIEDHLEWDELMFEIFCVDKNKFGNKFEDFAKCVPLGSLPEVEKEFRESVYNKKEFNIEFPITVPGGKIKYIAGAAHVIRDNSGRPVRVIGVNYDITERYERREKINQLSKAVEQSPACVVITDTEGHIEYVNPKFLELTGYKMEEVLGQNPRVLKSGELSDEVYRDLWEKITSGKEWRGEFHNKKKNGELYWEAAAISPIRDEKGKIKHFMAVKEDITASKIVEDLLRENNERFNQLAEQSHTIVWEVNAEGMYTYVNHISEEVLGYTPSEMVGKMYFYDLHPEEGREVFKKEAMDVFLKKGRFSNVVNLVRTKNGNDIWVSTNGIPMVNRDGSLRGYRGSDADITMLKRVQDELKKSRDEYQSLVSNIPGVTYRCLCNKEWTMLFISQEIHRMTGYKASDFVGNSVRTFESIIFEEDREMVQRVISEANSKKRPYDIEYRIRRCDGEILWVKEKGRALFDSDSVILYLDGVIFDITIMKKAEEELEQAISMQMEFTSTVSHELRTPLTAIKSGVAIVLDGIAGEINPDQKDFLGTVNRNVDRLTRLINDVLDFQRLKSGKEKFVMKKDDINRLAEETQKDMLPAAAQKGLTISLSLDGSVPEIIFDRDAITRVLVNLINNAIKFTEKGGIIISTKTKPEENVVLVTVEDTGRGIEEKDMPRLFDDFVQLDKGKNRQTGGTGLGLAISKKLVNHHGGRIWAESQAGKGTKFCFVLPIEERRASRG